MPLMLPEALATLPAMVATLRAIVAALLAHPRRAGELVELVELVEPVEPVEPVKLVKHLPRPATRCGGVFCWACLHLLPTPTATAACSFLANPWKLKG